MRAPDRDSPPAAAARHALKVLAEQVLWTRVEFQRRVSSPRPLGTAVAPTSLLHTAREWRDAVRIAKRHRLPLHPTRQKTWDTLGAVAAILDRFGPAASVLDAGSARYSTVLPWLRLYDYEDLVGINLEFKREVRHGPVRFRPGDVTATGLPDESQDAVTCLSVIEHGVPIRPFLSESARILRDGGLLSISTDYDRHPPDTSGLEAYGQPVRIFGPGEIQALVAEANRHGLRLIGDLDLEHTDRPVYWRRMRLRYTFILLSFERIPRESPPRVGDDRGDRLQKDL